jgi:hypothetical protein
MKKTLVAVTALATLFCGMAAYADPVFVTAVDGRPVDFEKGDNARFGVWYVKGEGYHLDVTTAGARHHFKGRISLQDSSSHFRTVDAWKGAGEITSEIIRDNWFSKFVKPTPTKNPRQIDFDFVSEAKNLSGIKFSVEGSGNLLWNLCVGGPNDTDEVACSADLVRIGKEGQVPSSMPFVTHAHPDHAGNGS